MAIDSVPILNLFDVFVNYVFGDLFFAILGIVAIIFILGMLTRTSPMSSVVLSVSCFSALAAVAWGWPAMLAFAFSFFYALYGMYRFFMGVWAG